MGLYEPGDTVQIELIRRGKKDVVEFELGERPAGMAGSLDLPDNIQIVGPTMQAFSPDSPFLMKGGALDKDALTKLITDQLGAVETDHQVTPEQISNALKNVDIDLGSIMKKAVDGNDSSMRISMSSSSIVDNESGATVSLTESGGTSTLKITGKDGQVVFNGPASTDEEKAKIPSEYRDAVERLTKIGSVPWGGNGAVRSVFGTNGVGTHCTIKILGTDSN